MNTLLKIDENSKIKLKKNGLILINNPQVFIENLEDGSFVIRNKELKLYRVGNNKEQLLNELSQEFVEKAISFFNKVNNDKTVKLSVYNELLKYVITSKEYDLQLNNNNLDIKTFNLLKQENQSLKEKINDLDFGNNIKNNKIIDSNFILALKFILTILICLNLLIYFYLAIDFIDTNYQVKTFLFSDNKNNTLMLKKVKELFCPKQEEKIIIKYKYRNVCNDKIDKKKSKYKTNKIKKQITKLNKNKEDKNLKMCLK